MGTTYLVSNVNQLPKLRIEIPLSGIAEFSIPIFMQGVAVVGGVVVLVWRILTYFIYLIIGALLLPRWLLQTGKKIH